MIIITGASKGIGKFLFEKFYCQGENVIGIYNSTLIENCNPNNMYRVDITDYSQVQNFFTNINARLEKIVLINSAGANYNSYAHKSDIEAWKNIIDINLIGTFYMTKQALLFMRQQNYGRIINLSSVVAQMSIPGTSAYAASKSALWGLSKAIAAESADKGITINNLNLGYFNLGMINDVTPQMKEILKSRIMIGHQFGEPINIFEAIKFIINAPYLTGTSIDINGGII